MRNILHILISSVILLLSCTFVFANTDYTEENIIGSDDFDAIDAGGQSDNDISSAQFEIDVDTIFQTGVKVGDNTDVDTASNFVLGTIIQKLMIGLGSIALVIMSIGAGYMILHAGQDELLSKGKSIFISGLVSVAVALCSYYLVSLIRYILFN
ncbi:hypothetical protein MK079_01575 [Candidatus Gracilibacteria bacterium]|nr:hypothetical protein [Candidatus Gracilibacteria bacterium]